MTTAPGDIEVLKACCRRRQYPALESLLKDPALLELARNGAWQTRTALHVAAEAGFTEGVKLLLKVGCPIDLPDPTGSTALHCAAYAGIPSSVRALLRAGPAGSINAASVDGMTPLHRIIVSSCRINAKIDISEQLCAAGADATLRTSSGQTPREVLNATCHRISPGFLKLDAILRAQERFLRRSALQKCKTAVRSARAELRPRKAELAPESGNPFMEDTRDQIHPRCPRVLAAAHQRTRKPASDDSMCSSSPSRLVNAITCGDALKYLLDAPTDVWVGALKML